MSVRKRSGEGREAVRLAAELKPDVIMMDLMMPKLNGAEAVAIALKERLLKD